MPRPSRRALVMGVVAVGAAPLGATMNASSSQEWFRAGLFIDLPKTRVPATATRLETSGHARHGLGAARYARDPDQGAGEGQPWRARDADGRWWLLAEPQPTYEMFGARAGGGNGDRAALQAANDYAAAAGVAEVRGAAGVVYETDREVQAGEGVINDLNGATIRANLMHPDDAALSVRNRSGWKNGRILVTSGVRPGIQANCHAGVRAGPIIGRSPSIDAIDLQEGTRGWLLENLVIDTRAWSIETLAGKVAVQITGGASDWVVRRITAPDSPVMAGLIHADWSVVGPIVSADQRQRSNRAAYMATPRRGWTTHPHNGLIEDCRGGRFTAPVTATDTGANGIRLSACHDIVVRNCGMAATTYAAIRIVGGDMGFEFALPEQRARAHKGLVFETFSVDDAGEGYACWIDLKADNIHRAAEAGAYSEMLDPVPETDIVVRSLRGATHTGENSGLRLNNLVGGQFIDCNLTGFRDGVQVDEGVRLARLIRPVTLDSRRHGGLIDHSTVRPCEVVVEQPVAERSGAVLNGAHWLFGNCDRCELVGGTLGAARLETARWGVVLARTGVGNSVKGAPRIRVRPGGEAVSRE